MFTLWTLLGCVYVQPLTYEDVSACITLTLSSRLLTNVLLKTRSHTRAHVFLRRCIYIPFCHIRLMSVSRTFQLLLLERITFDIQGSVFEHFVLTDMSARVFRLRVVFMRMFRLTRTRYSGWSERHANGMSLHTKRWELGLGLDLELDLVLELGLGL